MASIRLRLEYPLARIGEPIFTRLVTDFDVQPNVLAGNVDASRGGWLLLGLTGENDTIERATNWIRSTGIGVTEESA